MKTYQPTLSKPTSPTSNQNMKKSKYMNGIISPKSKQSSTVVTPKIVKRAGVARISNHDEIIHEVKIILEDYATKAYVEPLMTLEE